MLTREQPVRRGLGLAGRVRDPHRRQPREGAARQDRRGPGAHRARRRLRARAPGDGVSSPLLDQVTSVKVKLGLLVAASVTVAWVVAAIGAAGGVPYWLSLPVTVALALGVTQLLAVGMTSPAARDDRRRPADGPRRLLRPGHRDLERRGRRAGPGLQQHGRGPGRRGPAAPRAGGEREPRAAHPARRAVRRAREPRRRRRRAGPGGPARGARPGRAAVRARLRPARPGPGRRRRDAGCRRPRCRSWSCSSGPWPRPGSSGREVAVRRPRRAAHADRRPPTRRGCTSWSPTCSTTRRGTAPPAASSGSPPRRRPPAGGSRSPTTGPGIPAADRDRVFERFGTLTEAEGGGGTGLGLAIARWVTDLHGGTIHVVDPEPPSTGARVRVDLPHEPRGAPS